jgi:hypothetical protein
MVSAVPTFIMKVLGILAMCLDRHVALTGATGFDCETVAAAESLGQG